MAQTEFRFAQVKARTGRPDGGISVGDEVTSLKSNSDMQKEETNQSLLPSSPAHAMLAVLVDDASPTCFSFAAT